MGCPKNFGTAITQVPSDTKHDVRCCSPNVKNCTSTPCQRLKTYKEAENICSKNGFRLCTPDELDTCCGTGCNFDLTTNWVAKGTDQFFSLMLIWY